MLEQYCEKLTKHSVAVVAKQASMLAADNATPMLERLVGILGIQPVHP